MTDLKAIETQYAGRRFRSRTEARWAVFFDAAGIKWDYEKDGYDLGAEGLYLPDFWLPDVASYAEVKGQRFTVEEVNRCRTLARLSGNPVIMLPGVPAVRAYRAELPDGLMGRSLMRTANKDVWVEAVQRALSARFEHGETPRQEKITTRITPSSRIRRGERRDQHGERGASAERELIRAMLLDRGIVEQIAEKLDASTFHDLQYRAVYEALLDGDNATLETDATAQSITEEGSTQLDPARTIADAQATLHARDLDAKAAELDRLIPLASGAEKDALIAQKEAIRAELNASGHRYYKKFRRRDAR